MLYVQSVQGGEAHASKPVDWSSLGRGRSTPVARPAIGHLLEMAVGPVLAVSRVFEMAY